MFPSLKSRRSSYRLHNLGEYIFREETGGRRAHPPSLVLFEVDLNSQSHNNLLGINYLKLGEIHFDLFTDLEYLLTSNELFELKKVVGNNIVQSLPFFKLCNETWLNQNVVTPEIFLQVLIETIPKISILGYIYFESIAEYLMLYSDSIETKKYTQKKEINNMPYKRLIYAFYPEFKKHFRLNGFKPSQQDLCDYIFKEGFIREFQVNHFLEYITKKIIYLINQTLIADSGHKRIAENKTWSFEHLIDFFKPLLGHMIHRELRSFGRYPDFYFYFDQLKALQVWNYWNHMGVVIPFNGVFPKGEVGINPANSELSLRAFNCQINSKEGFLYAEPIEELKIRLIPRLVDLKYTLMRNKSI